MRSIVSLSLDDNRLKALVLNAFAISIVYFTPTLSHLLNLPIYLFEPMRIMLILALVHTNRANAYFLALTLPFVSFLFAGHPFFPKVALIAIELLVNVFLFYKLSGIIKNSFLAVGVSIILSKVLYYILKFALISTLIINTELISTPLYIQLITTVILSVYVWIMSRRPKEGALN